MNQQLDIESYIHQSNNFTLWLQVERERRVGNSYWRTNESGFSIRDFALATGINKSRMENLLKDSNTIKVWEFMAIMKVLGVVDDALIMKLQRTIKR